MATDNNKTPHQPDMQKAWYVAFALAAVCGLGYIGYQHMPSSYESTTSIADEAAANDSIRKAGEEFMDKIAKEAGVQPLGGGVFYKEIKAGTGAKPTQDSQVRVNYEGRLIDGTVFDSSYKRGEPATFGVGGVIQGWQIALKAMPVGSEWEVYIPQYYGYGAQGSGSNIPPYSALVFKVELLGIE